MREREKDEESMRIGKERRSLGKTDVPKLYAYNECEHYLCQKLYHGFNSHYFKSGFRGKSKIDCDSTVSDYIILH